VTTPGFRRRQPQDIRMAAVEHVAEIGTAGHHPPAHRGCHQQVVQAVRSLFGPAGKQADRRRPHQSASSAAWLYPAISRRGLDDDIPIAAHAPRARFRRRRWTPSVT